MKNSPDYLDLMTELSQKKVNIKKITLLCQKLKIPFSGDIIDLMTYVLASNLSAKYKKPVVTAKQTSKKRVTDVELS